MSLTGIWSNELSSKMLLQEHPDHSVTGLYQSMVGRDPNPRPLAGRTNSVDGSKQMIAWSVCFEVTAPASGYGRFSICAWSGWGEQDRTGLHWIRTHWLRTLNILESRDDWSATYIGEDVFVKLFDKADDKLFADSKAIADLYARQTQLKRTP
jgi:Avidin family